MKIEDQPVAIVTGGGSGIGRAAAIGLGAEGYRLVLVGRRTEPLLETGSRLGEQGKDWIGISADLAASQDRERIIELALSTFGRIDAIVNNAAIGTCAKLGDLDDSAVAELFAINAIGPIELVRVGLPELIRSRGCVVNVASVAMLDPFVGLGVYGCTKAAIDGLTRLLINEYGDQGIRAYTVSPGAVETSMLRSIFSRDLLPTEQTLSPESVAGQIVECVLNQSDHASGSTIVMNNG